MSKAEDSFKNIQDNLKNAIFLKQQLKYEESRKKKLMGILYIKDFLHILHLIYLNYRNYLTSSERQQTELKV
jgi:hypothetical protein